MVVATLIKVVILKEVNIMVLFTLVDDQFILCEVKEYFQLWGKNMVR
jgi:hypothetical protein